MAIISTSTALGGNATYNSGAKGADRADRITGSVFADQAGTVYIEQSANGTNWDISTDYAVTASDGKGFSEEVLLPYVRIRYTNGGTPQGAFRLYARLINRER